MPADGGRAGRFVRDRPFVTALLAMQARIGKAAIQQKQAACYGSGETHPLESLRACDYGALTSDEMICVLEPILEPNRHSIQSGEAV
jgi:hypothetical protein